MKMMNALDGKVAIVTGASSGIGRAEGTGSYPGQGCRAVYRAKVGFEHHFILASTSAPAQGRRSYF